MSNLFSTGSPYGSPSHRASAASSAPPQVHPRRRNKVSSSSSGSSVCSLTPLEMSPEKTLVEFISTSASFFDVERKSLKGLENEITRVAPNNIMPANAAAWYLAKRKFYLRNPPEFQLLPFLLKNHKDKFNIKNGHVEFLEKYDKEVARKKLRDLNHLGLVAYFSHKIEEYGVYLFDPIYYEKTEPFHAGLKAVTGAGGNRKGNQGDLLPSFFNAIPNMHLVQINPYLLALSGGAEPMEVRTNVVAVVTKMLDKYHGLLQFSTEDGTAKAIFSTKALFRDGFHFKAGDPMTLPAMEFDGYRLPRRSRAEPPVDYTWAAVLVWCGKKPSPRYNATKADLLVEGSFGNTRSVSGGSLGIDDVLRKPGHVESNGIFNPMANKKPQQPISAADCMQIGEVVKLSRHGVFVSLSKNHDGDKAYIPGWLTKTRNGKKHVTSVQGVVLMPGDLVGYYFDSNQKPPNGAVAVGFNVIVLKHKEEEIEIPSPKKSPTKERKEKARKGRKSRTVSEKSDSSKTSTSEEGSGGRNAKGKKRQARKPRTKSTTSEGGATGGEGEKEVKEPKPKGVKYYLRYLLSDPIEDDNESIHSNTDPAFQGAAFHDPDLDFDEYTDGEVDPQEIEEIEEGSKKVVTEEELEKLRNDIKEAEAKAEADKKAAEEKAIADRKAAKEAEKLKREEERKAAKEARIAEKERKAAERAAAKEAKKKTTTDEETEGSAPVPEPVPTTDEEAKPDKETPASNPSEEPKEDEKA